MLIFSSFFPCFFQSSSDNLLNHGQDLDLVPSDSSFTPLRSSTPDALVVAMMGSNGKCYGVFVFVLLCVVVTCVCGSGCNGGQ